VYFATTLHFGQWEVSWAWWYKQLVSNWMSVYKSLRTLLYNSHLWVSFEVNQKINMESSIPPRASSCLVWGAVSHDSRTMDMRIDLRRSTLDEGPQSKFFLGTYLDSFEANWILELDAAFETLAYILVLQIMSSPLQLFFLFSLFQTNWFSLLNGAM